MKPTEPTEQFLSVVKAAKLLGTSKQLIYTLIKQDKLKATNLNKRKTVIKRSDIDKLFENH